jgi:hypothetical protein
MPDDGEAATARAITTASRAIGRRFDLFLVRHWPD